MLKLDLSLFEQTPHLGTWDGVCLNSVGCTRYFVGLVWAFELAAFYVFFVRTNPTWLFSKKSIFRTSIIEGTLVPRATLRGVAELHVGSGRPKWRMFVTRWKWGNPRIQTFLKGHSPRCRVVHSIVLPLWRISCDLTHKIIHRPYWYRHKSRVTKDLGLNPAIN